jgi:hypothetical protein
MVFASAVLMLAGSPQTFIGIASAQESLFPVVEVLAVYGRHVSTELGQTLAQFWRLASSSPNKRREVRQRILPLRHHQAVPYRVLAELEMITWNAEGLVESGC